MSSLVFATNNAHKIAEIRAQLGSAYNFFSLQEIGCHEELPETTLTLEGNARQKAHFVKDHYGYDCFSEDTGLEIDALGGRPGVDTAHYAGPERSAAANNAKVLAELGDTALRTARFRTIICLVQGEEEHLFEGRCEGHIAREPGGEGGFGYDPIFVPAEGDGRSFADMGTQEKSQMSHRARAMQQLQDFLTRQADQ
ncbi:RdgB/HAM1 family non-canonical purine NTP pyrophosphatase [Neolewinella lacunae]|uniref:dITP/XTP pyrophosphatase n=1 Tax=Neolewinella lacunae TaxID=1517758 RepID=A0A923PMF2_9BACT|nr:RdgB/HAM1 family non-canonical purine NTP pyrophosphatase [Neolewinella lacunae]MBC6996752.1 RdgB/HAM1 family non-canonical purine NTP pyrophosphatase [Neolewinella lacunae]MDN3633872.1 RdgB/HAM1 family non-canonical purine NTP pyrophosphatase [Neolewinella lacunae]